MISLSIEKTELVNVLKSPLPDDFSFSHTATEYKLQGNHISVCSDFDNDKFDNSTFTVSFPSTYENSLIW